MIIKKPRFSPIVLSIIAVLIISGSILTVGQQNDSQQRLLEVRRRQIELQAARKQLDKSEKLVAQGLLPQSDVDRDRTALQNAQLNYQQASTRSIGYAAPHFRPVCHKDTIS